MRWDNLFDDLESQLEREIVAEELDVTAEEERLRLGHLSIMDRLAALHGAAIEHGAAPHPAATRQTASARCRPSAPRITLTSGDQISLQIHALGCNWISGLVTDSSGASSLGIVPIWAVAGVSLELATVAGSLGLAAVAASLELAQQRPTAPSRLDVRFALRDLCRRRHPVRIGLDGTALSGTIDRVGQDHLDLAIHDLGLPRRESSVREVRMIALTAIVIVRF